MTTLTVDSGKELRERLPRKGLAELHLPADRDPIGILEDQHRSRLPDLIGVRIGRMLQSPFAYYRGSAAVMAADLAGAPSVGPLVLCCGDAHISNFGFFASPERKLLFDVNDFDEASFAPWDWDLRRLAASVHIGGRENGMSETRCRDAVIDTVEGYRSAIRAFVEMTATERYFLDVDAAALESKLSGRAREITVKATKKARGRTSNQVLDRMSTRDDHGHVRIVDQPPVTRHVEHASLAELEGLYIEYLRTLREDAAYLLAKFRPVDFVLRIVGVGSVGTRCYVLALQDEAGEVLFMQAKEAQASVLTTYGGMPTVVPGREGATELSEGHRVVASQRVLQAQSDPFLGHIIGFAGEAGRGTRVDYYWRQFRDMKGSIDPSRLNAGEFAQYGRLCGTLLARAHSQSRGSAAVSGYLGGGGRAPEAVADWAAAYADVCEGDFEALGRAAASGRFPVERDV